MILIYRILINIIFIFSPLIIFVRLLKKKENFSRFKEKLGFFKKKKIKRKKLIWLHGASVGELQSIIPLVEKFEKNNNISQILITSNTVSSAKIIESFKFKKVIHHFFPIDTNFLSKYFINYWNPSVAIFVDSEIWPNMLLNLRKRKIKTILLNARITNKSFNRWMKLKNFANLIFQTFHICLCSNKKTYYYLKKLGARKIKYYGNLKYAQSENQKIKFEKKFLNFISNKDIWCASSTHETEEEFIGHVHKKLKKKYKNLLTIIIPRHIERHDEIRTKLRNLGLICHTHESKKQILKNTDIYLINSFGKTKSFFSVSKNVFLGGSLIKHGGQNPLEAVRYNCNILHGPNISNFSEIYEFLNKLKVSKKITNINNFVKILDKLFSKRKVRINIKNKIKKIGLKILNQNMKEIDIALNK